MADAWEGVVGTWFQTAAVADAAATSGDGCGQQEAPSGGASNDATGGAAVDALGGAACGEASAEAATAHPPPYALAASA
eukprot:5027091-Prymnesium_polylepis.1